jgi:hypothetical protein
MMTQRLALALSVLSAATLSTAAQAVQPFAVIYESESAGLQATTATFSTVGVETFESFSTGTGQSLTTDFGTGGLITGRYSNIQINSADQYGSAGGTGNYAVAFSDTGYALDLTTTLPGGVNYFGYWLSALDAGNTVTFFSRGRQLFTFNATDVLDTVNANPNPSQYFGNPNAAFAGQNTSEPYLFVNFFAENGSFDRIVFAENPMVGGYESDNHTVGRFLTRGTGTPVIITTNTTVPEPASWAMLITGFGLTGAALRRRRTIVHSTGVRTA